MFNTIKQSKNAYKSLLVLGGPIFVANVSFILTGMLDTIMVAQHSTVELAASAFANNVINAFVTLGTGFAYGVMPLIGENRAKKDLMAIGGWLKHSILANVSAMLLLMLGMWGIYMGMEHLGLPHELIVHIKPYYLIVFASVPIVMVVNSFRLFFAGIARPKVPMWILTISNILNVVGNYVFIYGKCGMPEMGLFGAGLSTFLSRLVMLLAFSALFLYHSSYSAYRHGFAEQSCSKSSWWRLNVIGWPIGVQQGLESATLCVTSIMIGWLGSNYLAAHQLAIIVSMFCVSIYVSIGAAVTINVSYAKGSENWHMVHENVRAGLHLVLAFAALICLVLFLTQDELEFMFTTDVEVNRIFKILLPILFLYQVTDSVLIVLFNALRGLADVKVIMWVSFLSYFIIALPLGYICGFILDWGISGVWLAFPLGFGCSALLLGLRVKKLLKMHLGKSR